MLLLADYPGFSAVDQLLEIAGTLFLDGARDLIRQQILVGSFFHVPKYSDRNRILRILHSSQHISKVGIAGLLIVDNQIRFCRVIAELDHLQVLISHPDSAIAPFSKYEWFAVLELDHAIILDIASHEHFKGSVVEDIAVLIHLDERYALVPHGSVDDHLE